MALIEALGFMALFMLLLCGNLGVAEVLRNKKSTDGTAIPNSATQNIQFNSKRKAVKCQDVNYKKEYKRSEPGRMAENA